MIRWLEPDGLPHLSEAARDLVRAGVWALWEVSVGDASLLLYSGRRADHWYLDTEGRVLHVEVDPATLTLETVVYLRGECSGPTILVENGAVA